MEVRRSDRRTGTGLPANAGRGGLDVHAAGLAQLLHRIHLDDANPCLIAGVLHLADDEQVGVLREIDLGDFSGQNRANESARSDNLIAVSELFKHFRAHSFQTYPNH